jgi:hypothetical protein
MGFHVKTKMPAPAPAGNQHQNDRSRRQIDSQNNRRPPLDEQGYRNSGIHEKKPRSLRDQVLAECWHLAVRLDQAAVEIDIIGTLLHAGLCAPDAALRAINNIADELAGARP